MKQEFITSRGKLVIEREVLFIRTIQLSFGNSVLAKVGIPLLCCSFLFFSFFIADSQFDYFKSIVYTFVFSPFIYQFYQILFFKSFAGRIPLKRIKSAEIKDGETELEKVMRFHLINGRHRDVAFRTLEGQYLHVKETIPAYFLQTSF